MACHAAASGLVDSAWQLAAIPSAGATSVGTEIVSPGRFTLVFAADGTASFRLDCNRGRAAWNAVPSTEPLAGSLAFGPLATTRMACAPGSLDQRVIRDLSRIRSYRLQDGKLLLSLKEDGGVYEWVPMASGEGVR